MLNWTDVLPHPDERVEWEFWSNSGDDCGAKCDQQKGFIRDFAPVAQKLEIGGYTQFTPHYVTWLCPRHTVHRLPDFCVKQCINNGRYCCPDPDDDFEAGYSAETSSSRNLRTLCVFRVGARHGRAVEVVGLRRGFRGKVHDGGGHVRRRTARQPSYPTWDWTSRTGAHAWEIPTRTP